MKTVKLMYVSDKNSNKFYNMFEQSDGNFRVEWGRVGYKGEQTIYPMKQWDKKYQEKIKKGYQDQTHLFIEDGAQPAAVIQNDGLNPAFKELLEYFSTCAKQTVAQNYLISSAAVTQKMVDEAQRIIDNLVNDKKATVEQVNEMLLNLYKVLPRKMKKVQEELIRNRSELNKKISDEQSLLDTMAGQVVTPTAPNAAPTTSIAGALGLEFEDITPAEIEKIKKMMGEEKKHFHAAYKVKHPKTWKYIDGKTTELLWHGSRNENWFNILKTGLKIRPSNVVINGAMYGNGIYSANVARKSLGYSSFRGSYWAGGNSNRAFLALFDVFLGKKFVCSKHDYSWNTMDYKRLRSKGDYDSVYAPRGADLYNDEFIVYTEEQMSVRYIVEVRG